jgi:hypothetical protein
MGGFSDFSLGGNSPILSAGKARWKPQKGKYRVSFIALPGLENGNPNLDADAPVFKGGRRLYAKGVGYYLDHGPEYQKIAGGPSKTAIATTLVFWPVDANGVLDKGRLSGGEFQVQTWVFSLDKYRQLEAIHAEFPLTKHDLNIVVTDPQYHKMTFSPCRDSLLSTLKEKKVDFFNTVVSTAKSIHDNLQNDIAQDLTIDQIREKLSGEVGSPTVSGGGMSSSLDVDDVLDDVLG